MRGLVRDAAGQPVAKADIVLLRYSATRIKPLTLQSDAVGRFAAQVEAPQRDENAPDDLDAAQLEAWRVPALIHAPGLALQHVMLRAADNDITLRRGASATGTVRDAGGAPVGGARVSLQYLRLAAGSDELSHFLSRVSLQGLPDENPLFRAFQTVTQPDGTWVLRDLPLESTAYVILDDSRFLQKSVETTIGATPDETSPAAPDLIANPGARITGRVLFSDGKPVPDAIIMVEVAGTERGYARGHTASDGTFSFRGLPGGRATLTVAPPDEKWAPAGASGVAVTVGAETRAPDITVGAGIALSGTITDSGSKLPVAGVRVAAGGPFGFAFSPPSDAQGRYTVRAVAGSTRFYIYSRPLDYLLDMSRSDITRPITANSKAAPDFALRRGITLTGTALDEAGKPATGATISSGNRFEGATTTVDAQGAWKLRGVDGRGLRPGGNPNRPSGSVILKTSGDWQIVGDGRVRANAPAPIQLTLRRIERQDVTVRVVTPEGEPVAGAKVLISILFDPTNGAQRMDTIQTNRRGEVVLRGLRPDESAEITPSKAGYTLVKVGAVARLDAKTDAPRVSDAVLSPLDATIEGRVIDAQGAPVANALVAPLFPGDGRDTSAPRAKTDAQGGFKLENLRVGETVVGAARGRDWGQGSATTGGKIEIKLQSAAPQPAPRDVERAFALLARWMDDEGPKPGHELTNLAENLAFLDRERAEKLLTQFGPKNREGFSSEVVLALVQRDPARHAAWGRAQIALIKDASNHEDVLMQLAMMTAATDPQGAQKIYDAIAPNVVAAPTQGAKKNEIGDAYRYATLAGLAGRLKHADAQFWRDTLAASVKRLSRDEQMFRIGGFAEAVAQGDEAGALQFLSAWEPALQVRALEDVIPVIAQRDLPAARRLLAQMETLVAQPDLPVEADRNDAMYRPTPTHSLDVARLSVIRKLLPSDPQAARAIAQKLADDGYGFKEIAPEAAARLPREAAIPALREAFEAVARKGYGEAGGMARIAALMAPFDTALSEQFFDAARAKLAGDKEEDEHREGAAAYAFYRASFDPTESRLLLENEWQRTLGARRLRPTTAAQRDDYRNTISVNRLHKVAWAMSALDFERASEMVEEVAALNGQGHSDIPARHHLIAWLLASEVERQFVSFERPRSEVLDSTRR